MIDFACKKFELKDVIKCSLGLTKSEFKIINFLMENRKKFNSSELAEELDLDLSTVQRSLKKLAEKRVIIRSQINLASGGYIYLYNINDKMIIRKIIKDIIHSWVDKFHMELERW